jgi:hypothetical protein
VWARLVRRLPLGVRGSWTAALCEVDRLIAVASSAARRPVSAIRTNAVCIHPNAENRLLKVMSLMVRSARQKMSIFMEALAWLYQCSFKLADQNEVRTQGAANSFGRVAREFSN